MSKDKQDGSGRWWVQSAGCRGDARGDRAYFGTGYSGEERFVYRVTF